MQGKMLAVLCLLPVLASANLCHPSLESTEMVKQRGYNLKGKVAVITGGDSGIGYGAAMGIAASGAKLIMLGFGEERAMAAAKNITRDTGNADIHVIAPFNLADFSVIRAAIPKILAISSQIDVLVCDAGLNGEIKGHPLSADGFEQTFQVTFLGHFLLTESLLPTLAKSDGRVANAGCDSNDNINLTYAVIIPENSTVCDRSSSPKNCTELAQLRTMVSNPLPSHDATYAFLAHFMKTFYARELAARDAGVKAYVAHPGLVATPGLPKGSEPDLDTFCPYPNAWYSCNCWSQPNRSYDKNVCPLSPLRGGNTLAYLATAPQSELKGQDGRFFAACEAQRGPIDQYSTMLESKGDDATLAYARSLTQMWRELTGLSS